MAVGLNLAEAKWAQISDFLAPYCRSYVFAREKGEKEGMYHLQGYCEIRASSWQIVGSSLKRECGLDGKVAGKMGKYSVCVKPLQGVGLHTRIGMIGYCLKDQQRPWFKCRMKGITEQEILDGGVLYMRLGATLKNRTVLNYKNILERAFLWIQFHEQDATKSIEDILTCMLQSGNYFPSMEFIRPRDGNGFEKEKVQTMWRMTVQPAACTADDVDFILFGKAAPLPRQRYFSDDNTGKTRPIGTAQRVVVCDRGYVVPVRQSAPVAARVPTRLLDAALLPGRKTEPRSTVAAGPQAQHAAQSGWDTSLPAYRSVYQAGPAVGVERRSIPYEVLDMPPLGSE